MDKSPTSNKQAMIVLHEIYGINAFIQRQCENFRDAGYDVFCPNMIDRSPFLYEESKEAYDFFTSHIGFEVYKEISNLVDQLKERYDNVFIIGFSIGATIAWRCCENTLCDGIIACYGSRIRDYTDLNPTCPTILLLAKEESFDIHALAGQLQDKQHLSIIEFDAAHGFMDFCSNRFSVLQSKRAEKAIAHFINQCI